MGTQSKALESYMCPSCLGFFRENITVSSKHAIFHSNLSQPCAIDTAVLTMRKANIQTKVFFPPPKWGGGHVFLGGGSPPKIDGLGGTSPPKIAKKIILGGDFPPKSTKFAVKIVIFWGVSEIFWGE